jgi:hypothetical protein
MRCRAAEFRVRRFIGEKNAGDPTDHRPIALSARRIDFWARLSSQRLLSAKHIMGERREGKKSEANIHGLHPTIYFVQEQLVVAGQDAKNT